MPKSKFSSIDSIIKSAKKGQIYILVDDENRENEGDLVVPAANVNEKNKFYGQVWKRFNLSFINKQAGKKVKPSTYVPNK